MKTDVTDGGHSATQSRSCLCRRSLCKWASLHKPSKVTVWFGAPSLEEPDNEVQFVRLFVCTTNLAWPHTGGRGGTNWYAMVGGLCNFIISYSYISSSLWTIILLFLPAREYKTCSDAKTAFCSHCGSERCCKTGLKDTLLTLTLFSPLNVLCKDRLIGRTAGVQNPKCTFSGSQT